MIICDDLSNWNGLDNLLYLLFFNPLLGLIRRSWHLSEAETALVYIMALLATAILGNKYPKYRQAYEDFRARQTEDGEAGQDLPQV